MASASHDGQDVLSLYADHRRLFHENRFVYPVLSRRSRGISIGSFPCLRRSTE